MVLILHRNRFRRIPSNGTPGDNSHEFLQTIPFERRCPNLKSRLWLDVELACLIA